MEGVCGQRKGVSSLTEAVKTVEKPKGLKTYKVGEGFALFTGEEIESMAQPRQAVKEAVKSPRQEICLYCANKSRDVCPLCGEEGKYRYLVPVALESWEGFDLIVMKNLVDWEPAARLAALYLLAWYNKR